MEFYETRMGNAFYNHTMPNIAKSLKSIAESLEKINTPSVPKYFLRIIWVRDGETSESYGAGAEMTFFFSSIERAKAKLATTVDEAICSGDINPCDTEHFQVSKDDMFYEIWEKDNYASNFWKAEIVEIPERGDE